jgi:enoyl-CoA hydratase/carnithine racemase
MRLAMGFLLDAQKACQIGLAQWLVRHAEVMAKTFEIAKHIANLPPLAARMAKESMNRGSDIPHIADASLVDSYRFMALEMTEDKTKAHMAWKERRPGVFRAR